MSNSARRCKPRIWHTDWLVSRGLSNILMKQVMGQDGRDPLDAGTSDAILAIQVFEHVANLDAYCAEICRLLRNDGTLLLSTHGTWLSHPHPENYRRWIPIGLIVELPPCGLPVDELFYFVSAHKAAA